MDVDGNGNIKFMYHFHALPTLIVFAENIFWKSIFFLPNR